MTLPIVCFSGQPLDHPLPTNRQQIMTRVARTNPVLFVETGDFLGVHLARGARRERGAGATLMRHLRPERRGERLWAVRALNLAPWTARYRTANRINGAATAAALRAHMARLGMRRPAVWIYDPRAADVLGLLGERVVAYDCVDHYVEQAGDSPRRRATIQGAEDRVLDRADLVFTTSRNLYEAKRGRARSLHLVENAADIEHFARAAAGPPPLPDLPPADRPRIGFIGNLTPQKVDLALLDAIAAARPGWELVLVGPAPDPAALAALRARPNVRLLGQRPYAQAPDYLAHLDVALIPYWRNAYTEGVMPLKLWEYLAAGTPVVASGLPDLASLNGLVRVAEGADAVVAACEASLRDGPEAAERRRAEARDHSLDARAARLLELVEEAATRAELAPGSPSTLAP